MDIDYNKLLSDKRTKIDEIDKQMLQLFKERMALSLEIAKKKKEAALPIFDAEREKVLKEKLQGQLDDESLRPYYSEFIEKVLDISKKYQSEI